MTAALAEELTEKIIGCAIEVHRTLGPGLLESVYRECMIKKDFLHRRDLLTIWPPVHICAPSSIPLDPAARSKA